MARCFVCDDPIDDRRRAGRPAKFCSTRCRVEHHRREKRYKTAAATCNEIPSLAGVLILELFPGAGLFGKAFEALDATVVRGPDILWGGDVRDFHGAAGRFDGVIGGPPCQFASRAAVSGTKAINLIPEYVRIVNECAPRWAVMENVREAKPVAPEWDYVFLRDFDCGGKTHRRRGFWFYNLPAPPRPAVRRGEAEYSVLASHWNYRGTQRLRAHHQLTPSQAADLQGFGGLDERIMNAQPGWKRSDGRWDGLSERAREILAVHMLGNGVPRAMGDYIAHYIATMIRSEVTA